MSEDGSSEPEFGDGAVLLERDDGVATIRLNKPELRNALTIDVTDGIADAIEELEGTDTRCVVVEGAEGTFCAGGDVNAMMELQTGAWTLDEANRYIVRQTGRAVRRVAECEFPTVAKIDGAAVGAGAVLAIACDLQLMSDDARIGFDFRRVGLAVDSGASVLLPRLVGENVAMELVFTGEHLGADRAKELGLVNRVFPADEFDDRVAELVETIADGPTVALRTSKRLLRTNRDAPLGEAIADEAAAQSAVFRSDDHTEGVESFLSKREPEFEGR